MKRVTSSPTRPISHSAARQWAAWQAAGRQYSRFAGELWQLRLPLMTMVGLTLLGVYDCTAAARLTAMEAAPTVQTAPAMLTTVAPAPAPAAAAKPIAFNPASLGVTRTSAPRTVDAALTEPAPLSTRTGFLPTSTAPPYI